VEKKDGRSSPTTEKSEPQMIESRFNKNNVEKVINKHLLCPYKCPNCDTLKEFVESRYKISSIIEEKNSLILEPFGRDLTK
jgi:hypothetical protein